MKLTIYDIGAFDNSGMELKTGMKSAEGEIKKRILMHTEIRGHLTGVALRMTTLIMYVEKSCRTFLKVHQ